MSPQEEHRTVRKQPFLEGIIVERKWKIGRVTSQKKVASPQKQPPFVLQVVDEWLPQAPWEKPMS
jgi:hypothetical protein